MKSKMNIKSHPLHTILIVFPIAFFTGCFLFDVLGWIYLNETYYTTAFYLNIAGIVGALLAAVPGLMDYIFSVPPKSSAKSRAAKHGIINTIVLVLFVVALYVKFGDDTSRALIVGIELLAVVLMCVAGWMGGTLVYRNQIGVDHRYANAGKFSEQYFDTEENRIEVADAKELSTDQMKLLHINGKRIVLGKTKESYVAFEDGCSHRGASLADGVMICDTVHCPWHGSQFDVTNGKLKTGPATDGIKTYKVEESKGKIYLLT